MCRAGNADAVTQIDSFCVTTSDRTTTSKHHIMCSYIARIRLGVVWAVTGYGTAGSTAACTACRQERPLQWQSTDSKALKVTYVPGLCRHKILDLFLQQKDSSKQEAQQNVLGEAQADKLQYEEDVKSRRELGYVLSLTWLTCIVYIHTCVGHWVSSRHAIKFNISVPEMPLDGPTCGTRRSSEPTKS